MGTLTSGSIDLKSLKVAGEGATGYITNIDSSGIWITPSGSKPTNTSTGAGATGTRLNGDGLQVYKAGVQVASYGTDATIGQVAANLYNVFIDADSGISLRKNTTSLLTINSSQIDINNSSGNVITRVNGSGLTVYDGSGIAIAEFGSTSYIGKHNGSQSYLQMDYHSLVMKDKELNPYFEVTDLRETDGRALLSEIFYYNGSLRFTVGFIIDSVDSVFVGSSQLSSSNYTVGESAVTITNYTPATGAKIQINYYTRSSETKSYTFGIRNYEDYTTVPIGGYSIAEGYKVTAGGPYSHAEGYHTFALGSASHAEGLDTKAYGINSHAEGGTTLANGVNSHAEGGGTYANGDYAHAEGDNTTANGLASHAQGMYTTANGYCETVIGRYNILSNSTGQDSYDTSNSPYILVLGNGNGDESSSDYRRNALTVDWDGNITITGKITAGGYPSGLLKEDVVITSSLTVNGSNYNTANKSVSKNGYTPIGIVGVHLENASGGSNNTFVFTHSWYLSGTTAYFIFRNTTTSAATIKVTATILYVKS